MVVAHALVRGAGGIRGDAIDCLEPRNSRLNADRLEAELLVLTDTVEQLGQRLAGRVPISHETVAARAAEQLVDGHARGLALDVPQRGVDSRDGRHRHRAPSPIRAPIEELPHVLDATGVLADQQRRHVLLEVGDHGEFSVSYTHLRAHETDSYL